MKSIKIIILTFLIFFLNQLNLFAIENRILFKVENEIITTIDIYDEINYLSILNKDLKKLDKNKIFEIAKNSLIKEKIKEIEILKKVNRINLNEEHIDKIIINFYSKMGINTIENFEEFFLKKNIDTKKIRKKVAIQSYWNNLIYSIYSNKININKEQIKDKFIESNKQKNKSYLLSEILFQTENKSMQENKFRIIKDSIIKEGFENTALLFSSSNSANTGGKLGWINENSLSVKIKDKLLKLNLGEHTDPIVIPGGFLILKINDIKEVEKKFDTTKELEKLFRKKTNEQLNGYSTIYFNKIKKSTEIEIL
jgi:peptidyl-prolyl cis-trans isomerase SurA